MKTHFNLRYDSRWGEELFLTGNSSELGLWNPEEAVKMDYEGPGIWSATAIIREATEYKYFIRENGQTRWEDGPNRILSKGKDHIWDWFGLTGRQTMKGVAVPLFSLRTEDDFGIGEYTDLPKLGDWCLANGLNIIQILPINDTTTHYDWGDSYPYNAISAFALNPIYLNLGQMGIKADATLKRTQTSLNKKAFVDYPKVLKAKWKYFETVFEQQWEKLKRTGEFRQFAEDNADWLPDYAQYCAERDGNGPDIHRFLQYHCDKQLREAVKALHDKGLLLKGDIPIGVNPSGVDVKSHPELFNLDVQVGAPPDDFAAEGQNWGFPSYNWDVMAKDGYAWWRRRLQVMARYFDAYRIDHILGFFRIWEIPKTVKSGLLGHFNPSLPLSAEEIEAWGFHFVKSKHLKKDTDTLFIPDPNEKDKYIPRIELQKTKVYQALSEEQQKAINALYDDFYYHRHNEFWKQNALKKLTALVGATGMTACGEDLGMIPACVPEVMQQLGIMSLEVTRMPKVMGHSEVRPEDLPENCVYTTGTHDMPTLRGYLSKTRTTPVTISYFRKQMKQHQDSPSKWNIYPLQDLLDMDEKNWSPNPLDDQINNPSNPKNQWKWRMRVTIESLTAPR